MFRSPSTWLRTGFDPDAFVSLTDTKNLSVTFAYNPASQIATNARTGDMYAWTGHGNGSTAYVENGLNQQVTIGGAAATWDAKGNLTSEPQSAKTYGYSSENLLTSASGGVTLAYDPALRLYQTVSGATTTRFLYDGVDAIAEYNGSNALQRRFVFDPTSGQPVLWYEGTGTAATNRRYLSEDERGSIVSVSGSTGTSLGLNTYDEYGKPGSANLGRYQYTGQKWLPEANLYDYKFRDYLPHLGIFAQTDPIGYEDSPNLYAYVLDDPVNLVDPLGLVVPPCNPAQVGTCRIIVTACQNGGSPPYCVAPLFDLGIGGSGPGGGGGGGGAGPAEPPIVITAKRKSQPRPLYCALFRTSPGVATIGLGGNVSVQLPGNVRGSGTGSGGVAFGGNWDVALFGTAGGGPTTAGTSLGGGLAVGGSKDARSVKDLSGFFSYFGGQYGPLSISRFSGYGSNQNKVTGIESTIGLGSGKSASAGGTGTWVSPVINLMELIGC